MKQESIKLYLGSRYSRLDELCQYREQIHASSPHRVIARWLDQPGQPYEVMTAHDLQRCCAQDIADLHDSQACVFFTQKPGEEKGSRGGRHTEFGMALMSRKTVIVVGPRENVFYYSPYIDVIAVWDWDTVRLIIETEQLRKTHERRGATQWD